jgi:two-component system, response regulator PdtaR
VKDTAPLSRQERMALKRTILVVEDHFLTRWGAAEYLRHVGFRVVEAVSAAEAISIMKCGVEVDLVFSDINMPGDDNAYAVARWTAEHRPTIPVLLTSGESEDPAAYVNGPLRQFVTKPYEVSAVEKLIRSMLAAQNNPL